MELKSKAQGRLEEIHCIKSGNISVEKMRKKFIKWTSYIKQLNTSHNKPKFHITSSDAGSLMKYHSEGESIIRTGYLGYYY